MTNKRVELIKAVRTLDLEMRKLELESRLTRLKAEQSIDDVCVGCAGPCDVTKLQKKFDEYKETVRLERIEHVDMLRAVNQHHHVELDKFRRLVLNESRRVECDMELIGKLHNEHRIEINKLEAQLVDKNKDSEVLKKVVDMLKNCDDTSGHAFPILYGLVDLLVDYLDAPEELDIDGHQDISITVALLERL